VTCGARRNGLKGLPLTVLHANPLYGDVFGTPFLSRTNPLTNLTTSPLRGPTVIVANTYLDDRDDGWWMALIAGGNGANVKGCAVCIGGSARPVDLEKTEYSGRLRVGTMSKANKKDATAVP
jgi:hypothetical protein